MSQGKTEAQENYDAKAKTTKSKGDEADSPGKILAGRQFCQPRQDPCRGDSSRAYGANHP